MLLLDFTTEILNILKTIALWIDWVVYELLTYAYALFAVMCRLNFSSLQVLLSTIVARIQILFGVVMLFIVAFNLLTYLVNPSKADQKGSNLAMKIIVSVGILVVGNFAFGLLDNLQNAILDENTIEKIIIGNNNPDGETLNMSDYGAFIGAGRWVSYNLFFSFYENPDSSDPAAKGDSQLKGRILNGESKFHQIVDHASDDIRYEYPIVSTFCGIIAIVMYVTFAIDVGVRAFNIMILRVIMPVAAMGYLIPKRGETILKNYVTTYITTYAQLFAKIFLSYLIVYLMTALMSLLLTQTANDIIDQGMINAFNNQNFLSTFPVFFRVILLILVFISLYLFYKNLPKLISKILGVEIQSGKGLIAKTMGIIGGVATLAIGGAAGIAGGLASGIAGGVRGKAGFVGTAKAAMHNAGQGLKKNVGSGLTKLGNNTIGEGATSKISGFVKNHSQEARNARREATEKYATEHASDRVKERKAADAREKAAKQKVQEEETLKRVREASNPNGGSAPQGSVVDKNNRIDATKDNTPDVQRKMDNQRNVSTDKETQERLEKQRELKETLKRKYQTRQDDELRNKGGQMDSKGTTHAPAKDMGAPSIEQGSAFGSIDMDAERRYQEEQKQKQNQPADDPRKRAEQLETERLKENHEKEEKQKTEKLLNSDEEKSAEENVFEKIEEGSNAEDAINDTYDEIIKKQKQQIEDAETDEEFYTERSENGIPRNDESEDEIFDDRFE